MGDRLRFWPLAKRNALQRSKMLSDLKSTTTTVQQDMAKSDGNLNALMRSQQKQTQTNAATADTISQLLAAVTALSRQVDGIVDITAKFDALRQSVATKCDKVHLVDAPLFVGGVIDVAGLKTFILDAPGAIVGDLLVITAPVLPAGYLLGLPSVSAAGKVTIRIQTPALIIAVKYTWTIGVFAIR